jgi:hypothetical protein
MSKKKAVKPTKAEKKALKLQKKTDKMLKKSTKKGSKAAKQFVKLGKTLLKLDDNAKAAFHKKLMKEKKVGLTPTLKLLQSIEKIKSIKVPAKKATKKKAA